MGSPGTLRTRPGNCTHPDPDGTESKNIQGSCVNFSREVQVGHFKLGLVGLFVFLLLYIVLEEGVIKRGKRYSNTHI